MGNFYKDNDDIQFLFRHIDLGRLACLCEEGFRFAEEFDYAPGDADEAVQNYEMVLDALGELAADFIAPRAESVDREGNTLNEDGTVTRARGIAEALEKLAQAEVMGFTLPYRFGGLNFPNLQLAQVLPAAVNDKLHAFLHALGRPHRNPRQRVADLRDLSHDRSRLRFLGRPHRALRTGRPGLILARRRRHPLTKLGHRLFQRNVLLLEQTDLLFVELPLELQLLIRLRHLEVLALERSQLLANRGELLLQLLALGVGGLEHPAQLRDLPRQSRPLLLLSQQLVALRRQLRRLRRQLRAKLGDLALHIPQNLALMGLRNRAEARLPLEFLLGRGRPGQVLIGLGLVVLRHRRVLDHQDGKHDGEDRNDDDEDLG